MTERAKKIQDGKRERALLALKERYRKSQEGGRDELIFITPGEAMTLIKALQELKEQEPVKPIRLENLYKCWYKCPSCSGNIVSNMEYCPRCGRKVKWDEI